MLINVNAYLEMLNLSSNASRYLHHFKIALTVTIVQLTHW